MKIGIPKEIKPDERRVGLTPDSVRELTRAGHELLVETGAGLGIGAADAVYVTAGATILPTAKSVFESAELIVKVKEPQLAECALMHPGQVIFTYLHLAADRAQAEALMQAKVHAIAYETVTGPTGGLPLLTPMSEVAGRMSVQVGAGLLQRPNGGRGVLLGGVPGVEPAQVVILGGGVAGTAAAEMAVGLRAKVTVIDRSLARLRELDREFRGSITTLYSTSANIERAATQADLVIGSVLIPGDAAPKLITQEMLASMREGSVLVDIAIDQGGCFESSRPTSHAAPTYVEQGVVHYCVTNMPGAVPHTSTFALNNATLPYVQQLAELGWQAALAADPGFAAGLNVSDGRIVHKAVAQALAL